MKKLLCILTMCFGIVLYAQANDNFDLDDVTIELVEEGEEITHQIEIPFIEPEGLTTKLGVGVAERRTVKQAAEEINEESSAGETIESQTSTIVNFKEDENVDDFLDVIEEETESLGALAENEEEEALALAEEMLQREEEEALELEEEAQTHDSGLEEEGREERALINRIKERDEEGEGITVYDFREENGIELGEEAVEDGDIKEDIIDQHLD